MKTLIKIKLTFFSTLFLISGLIIQTNGQAIVLISAFIPCANNGAGELVEGQLAANIISAPGRVSNSPYILRVSGILNGSASGTAYHTTSSYIDLNWDYSQIDRNGANTATKIERLKFEGGGIVFTMATILHITYTGGDGNDVLVEIEHNMEKCLTNRFRN